MVNPPLSLSEFLHRPDIPFEPGQTEQVLAVFLKVCEALQISNADNDQAKEIVRTLISLAISGERDPELLYRRVLDAFKSDPN